jgi:diaminopimelate decarboxylase
MLNKDSVKKVVMEFGSPLYVYDENIIRKRCKEIKELVPLEYYSPSYSMKANSNRTLLKIIKECGLNIDTVSVGEIYLCIESGIKRDEIFYLSNNATDEELYYAIQNDILVSVDSIDQLIRYGNLNPGGKVSVRINPGKGAGHSDKVITAGKSKFGIPISQLAEAFRVSEGANVLIIGFNQHIGSLYLEIETFLQMANVLLQQSEEWSSVEFVDFGGGFGVPCYEGGKRLDMEQLGKKLTSLILESQKRTGNKLKQVMVEPGRYVVAESGYLVGRVTSIKESFGEIYIGTDLGFNHLIRPMLYDAVHEINILNDSKERIKANIVGNICESGDVFAKQRLVNKPEVEDLILIKTVGAYGYSMSSNYNSRLRPAEILITKAGQFELIRERETLETLKMGM